MNYWINTMFIYLVIPVENTTNSFCVKAIETRNKVIHESCVNLDMVDIVEAPNSIKSVLDKLNPRLFKQLEKRLGRGIEQG